MTKDLAFSLFDELIKTARQELLDFTLTYSLKIDKKIDKSVVTQCDNAIDQKLTNICLKHGLKVVSEEGEHNKEIVESGNYITIDPIDGTLGYIDYVNKSLEFGNIKSFLQEDYGPELDFSLLLGIVENGKARFAACFNYVTKEKILLDAFDRKSLIRQNNIRNYTQDYVIYLDPRFISDPITNKLLTLHNIVPIRQATLGLKSLYTILNCHKAAITLHRVQTAGLWDVLPAAVAASAFGGGVYDDEGNPLVLTDYIILPGTGATIVKGEEFQNAIGELQK